MINHHHLHYQFTPNNITIINQLNILVNKYNHHIIIYSNNTQNQQLTFIQNLQNICISNNLTFPTITAMSVFDPNIFPDITSNIPTIIINHSQLFIMVLSDKKMRL